MNVNKIFLIFNNGGKNKFRLFLSDSMICKCSKEYVFFNYTQKFSYKSVILVKEILLKWLIKLVEFNGAAFK